MTGPCFYEKVIAGRSASQKIGETKGRWHNASGRAETSWRRENYCRIKRFTEKGGHVEVRARRNTRHTSTRTSTHTTGTHTHTHTTHTHTHTHTHIHTCASISARGIARALACNLWPGAWAWKKPRKGEWRGKSGKGGGRLWTNSRQSLARVV
jgi:hypothetical protein